MADKLTEASPLNEAIELLNGEGNPKDAAFRTMSENIWSENKLNQMHRFNKKELLEIFKNFVVILLYEKKWAEIRLIHTIQKTKEFPYYFVKTKKTEKNINLDDYLNQSAHGRLIKILTELHIGESGQARKEVFGFITEYAKVLQREQERQNPL